MCVDLLNKNFTQNMHDMLYNTKPDYYPCVICKEVHKDDYYGWHRPHPCGKQMKDDDAFVCSKQCGTEWKEINFEEIEEFENER